MEESKRKMVKCMSLPSILYNFVYLLFFQIVLNLTWQVVAGEESKEVEDQHKRELRVLEAIYPRISSIPSKFVSSLAFYDVFSWFPCFLS